MNMLDQLSLDNQVKTYFSESFNIDADGSLRFRYSSGDYEHFGCGFHLIPVSCGFWQSKNTDLNIVRFIIICSCAMDAVWYLKRNFTRYRTLEELLFISVGSCSAFSEELHSLIRGKRLSLLFSAEILDLITAVKFIFFSLAKSITLKVKEEVLICHYSGAVVRIAQNSATVNLLLRSLNVRFHCRLHKKVSSKTTDAFPRLRKS